MLKKNYLLIIIIVFLTSASLFVLTKKGFFNIHDIDLLVSVDDQQKNFVAPEIQKLNEELNAFKDQSMFSFSMWKMEQIIKSYLWVQDFRISRSWPSTISISLKPYKLQFLLTDEKKLIKGVVAPVLENAEVLSEISTAQAPGLAFLDLNTFSKNKEKRKKAIELLNSLPEDGKLNYKNISEVGYDQKNGYWVEVAKSKMKVILGEDQFAMKSARVSQVMDYLDERDLKARVIDANLSKKVLVRLQQNP